MTDKGKPMMLKADCLFCKIIEGKIPSKKVYEDDDMLAFHDINPAAAVHFLIVPKVHIDNLYDGDLRYQQVLGRMLGMAGQLAREQGANDGFRVIINNGRVGRQEVYHLHIHVLAGSEPMRSAVTPTT
jgi:histidine triad (HIT) family protein